MSKSLFGKKSSKPCPECGGETVIEEEVTPLGKTLYRRCDDLIEVDEKKPLQACTWSEEIHKNGRQVKTNNDVKV